MSQIEIVTLNINEEQKSKIKSFIKRFPIARCHVDDYYLINKSLFFS